MPNNAISKYSITRSALPSLKLRRNSLIMRKILFFLLMIFAIMTITACSSNNDDPVSNGGFIQAERESEILLHDGFMHKLFVYDTETFQS